MITRLSSIIRPEGSDLIFDQPYNADFVRMRIRRSWHVRAYSSPGSARPGWAGKACSGRTRTHITIRSVQPEVTRRREAEYSFVLSFAFCRVSGSNWRDCWAVLM